MSALPAGSIDSFSSDEPSSEYFLPFGVDAEDINPPAAAEAERFWLNREFDRFVVDVHHRRAGRDCSSHLFFLARPIARGDFRQTFGETLQATWARPRRALGLFDGPFGEFGEVDRIELFLRVVSADQRQLLRAIDRQRNVARRLQGDALGLFRLADAHRSNRPTNS